MAKKKRKLKAHIGIVLLVLCLTAPSIYRLAKIDWQLLGGTEEIVIDAAEGAVEAEATEDNIDDEIVGINEKETEGDTADISSDDTSSNTTLENTIKLQIATVVRVVDGDTLVVEIDDENQYVRLIGIDAAESVHPDESKNTEAGQAASDYLKSMLSAGDIIYLQKDVSETDKYNRLLRYVWLEMPDDVWNEEEVIDKMLNAILIIDGYADPVRYAPDTSYAELFESL